MLHISVEHDRLLDSFPPRVRNELRQRMDNAVALPVSLADGGSHETTIIVDGYRATLRLDAAARTVSVVSLSAP